MEYRLERVNSDNVHYFNYLFKEVRGMDLPADYFKRKFDTGWTGIKNLGFIAFDEAGNAAACYGVMPCYALENGKRILIAQCIDAVTHQDHRNRGLFKMLTVASHNLAKENGVSLVYSFPNANSYHGFTKSLHFEHYENYNTHTVKTQSLPLYKIATKFMFLYPMYKKFVASALVSYAIDRSNLQSLSSVTTKGDVGVERDHSFIMHREYSKTYVIETEGAVVWFTFDDGLLIGDIEPLPGASDESILSGLAKLCKVVGAHQYKFSCSPGTYSDRLFGKVSSISQGSPICFLDLNSKLDGRKLKFTWADSDSF